MNIKDVAKKPELTRIELNSDAIVEKYGEALEFYVYDIQPMDVLMRMSTLTEENLDELIDAAEGLILDEAGEPVCGDGYTLPLDVKVAAIQEVGNFLGKGLK